MITIPEISDVDIAFGNIDHLPDYEEIPDEFKNFNDRYGWPGFVSDWFFSGLKQEDLDRIEPKEGVDAKLALRAVSAILRSFLPKHEHKNAGAAYLMSEWFTLKPKEQGKKSDKSS